MDRHKINIEGVVYSNIIVSTKTERTPLIFVIHTLNRPL
jgi:hypothetical protein